MKCQQEYNETPENLHALIERKKLFSILNISISLTKTFGITVEYLQKQLNDMFWPIAKLHTSHLNTSIFPHMHICLLAHWHFYTLAFLHNPTCTVAYLNIGILICIHKSFALNFDLANFLLIYLIYLQENCKNIYRR